MSALGPCLDCGRPLRRGEPVAWLSTGGLRCFACWTVVGLAPRPDPLQLPEEPYATVARPGAADLLEGATVLVYAWLVATAAVTAGLAAVLLVLGLRRLTRG